MGEGPSEKELLLGHLGAQRAHALATTEGLSEEQMNRAVLPSAWTLAQLINHLALDNEKFWVLCVMGADPDAIASLGDGWVVESGMSPEGVLQRYRDITKMADGVLSTIDLDRAPAWWPEEQFGGWRMHTNREVLMHLITETSCHTGHLDAARELIDRRQWRVLT